MLPLWFKFCLLTILPISLLMSNDPFYPVLILQKPLMNFALNIILEVFFLSWVLILLSV